MSQQRPPFDGAYPNRPGTQYGRYEESPPSSIPIAAQKLPTHQSSHKSSLALPIISMALWMAYFFIMVNIIMNVAMSSSVYYVNGTQYVNNSLSITTDVLIMLLLLGLAVFSVFLIVLNVIYYRRH